ncbi:unnamed protein product [Echinostoma caproni]|uniref:NR LBD domain-containing protein n=1 Tax=Echinostoma caproni TaxID=27848 RepID=A0A183AJ93_9TREM|nr:unnamed protein product [Echinostoma caproni]
MGLVVLDEDKRLAKRRLIEANRARKRAESEGGMHTPVGGNGHSSGPTPPKQSPSGTAAGYAVGTSVASIATTVKQSQSNDMSSFSHPHPPNLTVYSQTSPGTMGITVNYAANGSTMTLPMTQVPVGPGPSVPSSPIPMIVPCPTMPYGRQPVTAPPYEPNVPHLVQQPSGHLMSTEGYSVTQLGPFVSTKPINTTDDLSVSHGGGPYSGATETTGFWHPVSRPNGSSPLASVATIIGVDSSQRVNMYHTADAKVEWSGEFSSAPVQAYSSMDSPTSARSRGQKTSPPMGITGAQSLRSLGNMTCDTMSSNNSSNGSVERHQALDGLSLNMNNGPTLPLISTLSMDGQPGSTNTSDSMIPSALNSPPSGFTMLNNETGMSNAGGTAGGHTNEACHVEDVDSQSDFPWTQEDQDLVDTIRKAYDTIHFANAEPNVLNSNGTNNSLRVHMDEESEPGKYVVQSIVDSQVTGFLTKVRRGVAGCKWTTTPHPPTHILSWTSDHSFTILLFITNPVYECSSQQLDDVEREDINQARAFYSSTFCDLAHVIEPMIACLVAFAKRVPGFGVLGADDQIRLVRDCCLDLITLRAAYSISLVARTQGFTDHLVRQPSLNSTIRVNKMEDEYKPDGLLRPPPNTVQSASQPTTTVWNGNNNTPPYIMNSDYPKLGTSDERCAQGVRSVALKLARLNVDQTEVAMMAAILLMSPDRSDLIDIEAIEETQNNLLETFNRRVNRIRRQNKLSPIQQCWPRIIMALTEIRSITMCTQEFFLQEPSANQCQQLPWFFHELFLGHNPIRTSGGLEKEEHTCLLDSYPVKMEGV